MPALRLIGEVVTGWLWTAALLVLTGMRPDTSPSFPGRP